MLYFQELITPVFVALKVDLTPENSLKNAKNLKNMGFL